MSNKWKVVVGKDYLKVENLETNKVDIINLKKDVKLYKTEYLIEKIREVSMETALKYSMLLALVNELCEYRICEFVVLANGSLLINEEYVDSSESWEIFSNFDHFIYTQKELNMQELTKVLKEFAYMPSRVLM